MPVALPTGQGWAWFYYHVHALHGRRTDPVWRRLEAARRFLDAHLDEPLTLDEAARRAHLSKFHFLRLFKRVYHDTPLRYLRRRRLEAARQLLTRSELPVTDICFRVGFESLGSFSALFRRLVGESPSGYRRRYVVVPRAIVPPERLIPCCWLRRYGVTLPDGVTVTPQF
jgi:AraC-like DNA-binding protein